jgi:hypothetical protein
MNTRRNHGGIALAALSLALVTLNASPARGDNPIIQTNYTADPAPMVYQDRLYLYTSHDEDVTQNDFYTMNDWRLYSTVDMVNWTDLGSPAGYRTFSWGTGDAWAPQGVVRDDQFYLYVPLNNATGSRIGVGVSSNAAGPFTDPLGKELAASGSGNIDPTVFVDDDGQAYMYWGNGTLRYVKLNTDMTSYSGAVTNVSLNGFVEGPWFYKRESLYYLVYAAGSGNEKISYATSDGPTGPWTTRGDVMASTNTFTNHPGVAHFKGHSYFFYHNSALPGGNNYKRSVCVQEFTYGTDGSIPQLTMNADGPEAIATLNPFEQVEAETIAFSSGLKTEACSDTGAGLNVTSINSGDYIKVKNVDFLDGVTAFEARVSSAAGDAKIELYLDSQNGEPFGTCDVSGVASWTTQTCSVSGASGEHDLFLKFVGADGELFDFNWWKFTGTPMSSGGAGGAAGVGGASGVDGGLGADPGAAGGSPSLGGGGAAGIGGTASIGNGSSGSAGMNPASGGIGNSGSMSSTGGSSNAAGTPPSSGSTSATSPVVTALPPIGGGTTAPTSSPVAPSGTAAPAAMTTTGAAPSASDALGNSSSSDGDSSSCTVGARQRNDKSALALAFVALGLACVRRRSAFRIRR